MKKLMQWSSVAMVLAVIPFLVTSAVWAEEDWTKSPWGPKDEIGNCNLLTAQKVLEAVSLIKTGKIYDLGTTYEDANPAFPPRFWKTLVLAHGAVNTLGKNKIMYLEEVFTGCPGAGTQLDGFAHISIDDTFYNGFKMKDVMGATAVKKFAIENVPPIFTRAVLIDMVAYKGRPLEKSEPITSDDIKGFLAKHNLEIRPGDAVLINTGWMRFFRVDNAKYMSSEPGITIDAARWLSSKKVVGVGTDQWATEVLPNNDDAALAFPVHQELLAKSGIHLFQNLVLDKLAADKVYESAFVFTHPKIKGTTQGIGQPIAIK
ncbi:MAG: cyclase family protein [Deltaproteobacteria bacterium]|nr:cyclase family protein [Deltaproteobacteria bacterium]